MAIAAAVGFLLMLWLTDDCIRLPYFSLVSALAASGECLPNLETRVQRETVDGPLWALRRDAEFSKLVVLTEVAADRPGVAGSQGRSPGLMSP